MAYQKLQVGLAAPVIKSNTIDIPLLSSTKLTGTTTGTTASKLVNSNAATEGGSFLDIQGLILPGAIVVNETDQTISIVDKVDSATQLDLAANIFTASPKDYSVYLDPKANHSEGCIIYCGGTGDIKVRTVCGNDVTYVGVPTGTFLPVQVIRVFDTGTSATGLIANW